MKASQSPHIEATERKRIARLRDTEEILATREREAREVRAAAKLWPRERIVAAVDEWRRHGALGEKVSPNPDNWRDTLALMIGAADNLLAERRQHVPAAMDKSP